MRHEDCGILRDSHASPFLTRSPAMRTFHCNRCEHLVFFENVRCERCEALLGYLPDLGELSAFEEAGDGLWRSLHPKAEGALYRQCHNYAVENVCNWMIPADQPETLCRSCQLTRTHPEPHRAGQPALLVPPGSRQTAPALYAGGVGHQGRVAP
jgi:hypothetical protein